MKRLSVYIKSIEVQGILSKNSKRLDTNIKDGHFYSSDVMMPNDEFNVIASENVKINLLNKDELTNSYFDIGGVINTPDLIKIEVRSFEPKYIYNLKEKRNEFIAVVLIDLVF